MRVRAYLDYDYDDDASDDGGATDYDDNALLIGVPAGTGKAREKRAFLFTPSSSWRVVALRKSRFGLLLQPPG